MRIRPIEKRDRATWLRMRGVLWPVPDGSSHAEDIDAFFNGTSRDPAAVLVVEDESDQVLGFSELSLRSHAEGCSSYPVAYLEGWYVKPETRRRGAGRALVEGAQAWARAKGCIEFASDADLTNDPGIRAHLAVGFTRAGWIACFRKTL